jgi:hypothetical protein
MTKKATVLATACVMIIVVVFFEFYVFRIKEQGIITVGDIMAYPSEWVNRTVTVKGNLSKSTTFGSFDAFFFNSSWLYRLSSGGKNIEVNASANLINWNFDPNSTASVVVYGVVQKLSFVYDSGLMATVYYITANKVGLVINHAF